MSVFFLHRLFLQCPKSFPTYNKSTADDFKKVIQRKEQGILVYFDYFRPYTDCFYSVLKPFANTKHLQQTTFKTTAKYIVTNGAISHYEQLF